MSMTDPIADFLTRIRNGIMAAHETVEVPASRFKRDLARILVEQGYILGYDEAPGQPGSAGEKLLIRLKYTDDRTSVISGLRRVSRPGQRTYVDAKHIPKASSSANASTSVFADVVIVTSRPRTWSTAS